MRDEPTNLPCRTFLLLIRLPQNSVMRLSVRKYGHLYSASTIFIVL